MGNTEFIKAGKKGCLEKVESPSPSLMKLGETAGIGS